MHSRAKCQPLSRIMALDGKANTCLWICNGWFMVPPKYAKQATLYVRLFGFLQDINEQNFASLPWCPLIMMLTAPKQQKFVATVNPHDMMSKSTSEPHLICWQKKWEPFSFTWVGSTCSCWREESRTLHSWCPLSTSWIWPTRTCLDLSPSHSFAVCYPVSCSPGK